MSRKKATGVPKDPAVDPRVLAVTDLVGRTGATGFQLRYSDDERPVVWLAVATYDRGAETASAFDPGEACWRLGERLIDGGLCQHCGKPTALLRPEEDGLLDVSPVTAGGCAYVLRGDRIVRGCEPR